MSNDPQDSRDVAAAYWGQGAPKKTDIHNLGPPPRTLTIGMEEYVRAKIKSGPWVALTIFAVIFLLPFAFVMGKGWWEPALVVAAGIGLVVFLKRSVEGRRKDLRWFLEHAELHHATIERVHARIYRARSPIVLADNVGEGLRILVARHS